VFADPVQRNFAARKLLDAAIAADVVAVAMRTDNQADTSKVDADFADDPLGLIKMRKIGGVDQRRPVAAEDKMVGVQVAALNKKQIRQDLFQLSSVSSEGIEPPEDVWSIRRAMDSADPYHSCRLTAN